MEHPVKVSIVVPVYKVENYLAECVDSLLRQTYRDIEVILVDDGSPDHCGTMCDAYKAKDNRVKVLHQKNQGLSVARNSGLQEVTGEYVAFVDSDDVVSEEYVAYLLRIATENDAPMAACQIADFRDGTVPELTLSGDVLELSSEQALRMFFYQDRMQTNVLGKLFHRTLLWPDMFEPGILYEDAEPMYRVLYSAGRIAWSDAVLAGYRHRNTAQSRQGFSTREMDCVKVWQRIERDVSSRCPGLVIPATCRAFSAYSHIFFMIPKGTYESENTQVWKLMTFRRGTVIRDSDARKKARVAALLSYSGKNIMKWFGNYLLARENRKIFKEQK